MGLRERSDLGRELGDAGRRYARSTLGRRRASIVQTRSWIACWRGRAHSGGWTERMTKRALITGITGQDGSYLAELLLAKGYEVHGLIRRSSSFSTGADRAPVPATRTSRGARLFLHYGDLTDSSSLIGHLHRIKPGRGLQPRRPEPRQGQLRDARVHRRHDRDGHAAPARGGPPRRLADPLLPGRLAARCSARSPRRRRPRRRRSIPRSPYAVAKVFAHWMTRPVPRGVRAVRLQRHPVQPRVAAPRRDLRHPQGDARRSPRSWPARPSKLYLGNLDAQRDWGYAPEYVEAMWLMLQQPTPDDYVIATGEMHTRPRVRRASPSRLVGLDWERLRRDRPALLPPDRGRRAVRRRGKAARDARLAAARRRSTSSSGSCSRPTCARPASTRSAPWRSRDRAGRGLPA